MKLLIVCSNLHKGGAERVGSTLANGLVEREHEVMVVSNLFDPIIYHLDERVMVRNLVSDNHRKWKKWGSAFGNVRKAVKEFKPDVVIGIMSTCSIIARLATVGIGIPVIATEHNSFERPSSAPFSKWEIITKYVLNKMYSHVTVLTEADRHYIGTRLKNVVVMPNPLAIQPVEMIPEKNKVILAAGRLDDWHYKGLDVLIRAWGQINRNKTIDNGRLIVDNGHSNLQSSKLTGWRLQIAGTGSEESLLYLKQLCKESGVEDSVDFLGYRTDIQNLFQRADIFVLSSRYEGFGLVLIEAMSQGCACVACDFKGRQREIMNPSPSLSNRDGDLAVCDNGILCEPEDAEALANALKKMMVDEDYRHQAQKNAIERSKYYSIENTMDRWETLLKEIVKK